MMFSFGLSVKVVAPLLVVMVVILGGVTGLQASNFAGITINRHFRGDIFHNEGETPFNILRHTAIDGILGLSSASHHQLV